jgi:hypothetical protein
MTGAIEIKHVHYRIWKGLWNKSKTNSWLSP